MSDKLQELTDKLYKEGLSKGKQEGEEMLAKAKSEAASIVAAAKQEAEKIVAKAEKDAEDLKSKVGTDLKMAYSEALTTVKQQIEEAVTTKAIGAPVKEAFADKEYVKTLIASVVKAFNAASAEPSGLDVILPAAVQKELGDKHAAQLAAELGKGMEVRFDKNIAGGFRIAPKDGGFQISFTEEDFTALICQYLRPATKKILFG